MEIWLPLSVVILCGGAGIIGWYLKSEDKFYFGIHTWKVNIGLALINVFFLALAL